jgi:hypothetical protein
LVSISYSTLTAATLKQRPTDASESQNKTSSQ